MMDGLRNYLLSIVAAALLVSLAQALIPVERMRKLAGLIGGLVLMLTVLAPLRRLSFRDISQEIGRLWLNTDAARTGIVVDNRGTVAAIIKEKAETYILDKAASLGCTVQAEVTVEEQAEYPYPAAVTIRGRWTEEQKNALRSYLETDLAIPEEAQTWNEG